MTKTFETGYKDPSGQGHFEKVKVGQGYLYLKYTTPNSSGFLSIVLAEDIIRSMMSSALMENQGFFEDLVMSSKLGMNPKSWFLTKIKLLDVNINDKEIEYSLVFSSKTGQKVKIKAKAMLEGYYVHDASIMTELTTNVDSLHINHLTKKKIESHDEAFRCWKDLMLSEYVECLGLKEEHLEDCWFDDEEGDEE